MNQDTIWLALSVLVLCCFAAAWAYKRMRLRRARTWPKESGRVTSTNVRLAGSGTQQSRYVAEVMYSYKVQNGDYYGRMRRTFMLHSKAHKWADSYSDGRPLIIRYDPKNVRDSVLLEAEQTGSGSQ